MRPSAIDGAVLETTRVRLRELSPGDAPFILELLNEPAFLHYIGDKKVRTVDDARRYIETEPIAAYEQYGYGLYLVERREDRTPIGICGLLRRAWLDGPDVGFAFLGRFMAKGYGYESAAAVLGMARRTWDVTRVYAITSPDNAASIGLLVKLGFSFERVAEPAPGDRVNVYACTLPE
jgi:RimJ/RimL family protein N-acetyltransferase